jgi:SAM-dependent methyltransferase
VSDILSDPGQEYRRFHELSAGLGAPPLFYELSRHFVEREGWKGYPWLLDLIPMSLKGCTAVDVGCKYGHAIPLFFARGAQAAIGVDVIDEYLETARRVVGGIYPRASFVKSDRGYLPLAPESTDFVLVNEVISHVNPSYLPTLYAEIARILRPGGYLMISDGNNIANDECRRNLLNLYDAWENGPPGRNTGRDVVEEPFLHMRRRLIAERHPSLPPDKIDHLARNTSGLFGDYFRQTVDDYVATGKLVERPYRRGLCPTNPMDGGMVMEFGFDPRQVELDLAAYGIDAHQVLPRAPSIVWKTPKLALGTAIAAVRHHARHLLNPQAERGASWGFQVLGRKMTVGA